MGQGDSTRSRRHNNDGLRKLCECPRRTWAKCPHAWHFNFKWAGETYRFSLERRIGKIMKAADGVWKRDRTTLGDSITNKTQAEDERDRLRAAIRAGSLQPKADQTRPQRETLTLGQLLDTYRKRYLQVRRQDSQQNTASQIRVILRTELERADGTCRPFGDWLVSDITADTLEQFHRIRAATAPIAANRDLALLRAMFSWAVGRDHLERTPFKKGTETIVKLARETARRRRLQPGEGDRLLSACRPHLRALVEAALETGCRKGELLSLQWWQVRLAPKAEIFLPSAKTKTKADRTIPMSTRLKGILDMRRTGPDGQELPADAYVFGNEVGERVKNVKRAWQRAVLTAHGHRPRYVVRIKGEGKDARKVRTALLTAESQAALRAIDLHFHDLRREAGSRWLDAGLPLHRIQKWLGHANISQTSTYLLADSVDDGDAMKRFEEHQAGLQRIATDSENGAQMPPPDAEGGQRNPERITEKHH